MPIKSRFKNTSERNSSGMADFRRWNRQRQFWPLYVEIFEQPAGHPHRLGFQDTELTLLMMNFWLRILTAFQSLPLWYSTAHRWSESTIIENFPYPCRMRYCLRISVSQSDHDENMRFRFPIGNPGHTWLQLRGDLPYTCHRAFIPGSSICRAGLHLCRSLF